jgi:hypothetical protein
VKAGITGHQEIGGETIIEWVKLQIMNEFKSNNIELGYSCIAKGADQLFARILFEKRIDLVAVVPCKKYETTFTEDKALNEFLFLKNYASKEIDLNYDEPSEQAFFEGGKTVVNYSDILFAVWNGLPAKGLGGTGDVVNYAKEKKKHVIHINPINKTIKHLEYGKH